jgi:hypothetical protein
MAATAIADALRITCDATGLLPDLNRIIAKYAELRPTQWRRIVQSRNGWWTWTKNIQTLPNLIPVQFVETDLQCTSTFSELDSRKWVLHVTAENRNQCVAMGISRFMPNRICHDHFDVEYTGLSFDNCGYDADGLWGAGLIRFGQHQFDKYVDFGTVATLNQQFLRHRNQEITIQMDVELSTRTLSVTFQNKTFVFLRMPSLDDWRPFVLCSLPVQIVFQC